jgi:plastocyanin
MRASSSRPVDQMSSKVRSISLLLIPTMVALAVFFTQACFASTLRVSVIDPAGKPVPNIVVVLTLPSPTSIPVGNLQAIMDQVDKAFVPEVLVVRTGTAVTFPNSDSIAHQVYSFSPAKRFALPLYRGRPYPPVVLDQAGIVTLGCNIHDRMVGYIFVTDSPYFGKTDAQGRVEIHSLLPATYQVTVWNPHLAAPEADKTVVIADANDSDFTIRLTRRPRDSSNSSTDHRIRDY